MWRLGAGAVMGVLLAGCANMFLVGATPRTEVPAGVPRFRIPSCVNRVDGSALPGMFGTTYYLARTESGPILIEMGSGGEGTEIRNHWRDDNGDHFFAYVRGSNAWHYLVPPDQSRPPVRHVFLAGTYSVAERSGVVVPQTGEPVAECALEPF